MVVLWQVQGVWRVIDEEATGTIGTLKGRWMLVYASFFAMQWLVDLSHVFFHNLDPDPDRGLCRASVYLFATNVCVCACGYGCDRDLFGVFLFHPGRLWHHCSCYRC
jgi:hypothetical protein